MLTWHYLRPTPLQNIAAMAAKLSLIFPCCVFVAFLTLSVFATPSRSHTSSEKIRELFSRDVVDREDFIDRYLTQFRSRVWEVLASHGVQVCVQQVYTRPT